MKKVSTLIIIVLSIVLIFVFGYVGYGSTMINIENEKSIINHLSSNKNNPINILATQKYGNSFLIVYTDPVKTKENKYSSYFSCFTKHKFYKNRYKYQGGTTGKQTEIMVSGITLDNEIEQNGTVVYAIANVASEETKCSIFETDSETGIPIKRLDVIDVLKGQPYIIVKKYQIQSPNNMLIAYNGEIELSLLTGEEENETN